jgi:hypothetical protein
MAEGGNPDIMGQDGTRPVFMQRTDQPPPDQPPPQPRPAFPLSQLAGQMPSMQPVQPQPLGDVSPPAAPDALPDRFWGGLPIQQPHGPLQRFVQIGTRRGPGAWGQPDFILGGARRYPGLAPGPWMPQPFEFDQIVQNVGGYFRQNGSVPVQQFSFDMMNNRGGMSLARLKGQEAAYKYLKDRSDAAAEQLHQRQTEELQSYADIYQTYKDDPDRLKQELYALEQKYNDPRLRYLLDNDPHAIQKIHDLMADRDIRNDTMSKYLEQQRKIRDDEDKRVKTRAEIEKLDAERRKAEAEAAAKEAEARAFGRKIEDLPRTPGAPTPDATTPPPTEQPSPDQQNPDVGAPPPPVDDNEDAPDQPAPQGDQEQPAPTDDQSMAQPGMMPAAMPEPIRTVRPGDPDFDPTWNAGKPYTIPMIVGGGGEPPDIPPQPGFGDEPPKPQPPAQPPQPAPGPPPLPQAPPMPAQPPAPQPAPGRPQPAPGPAPGPAPAPEPTPTERPPTPAPKPGTRLKPAEPEIDAEFPQLFIPPGRTAEQAKQDALRVFEQGPKGLPYQSFSRYSPQAADERLVNDATARNASLIQSAFDKILAQVKQGKPNDPWQKKAAESARATRAVQKLDPGMAAKMGSILRGESPIPVTGFAANSPYLQTLDTIAHRIDPTFGQYRYKVNSETRANFTRGQLAQQRISTNRALGHLFLLYYLGQQLDNMTFPDFNALINNLRTKVGDARANDFQIAMNAVSNEMERAFRGTGGSQTGIEEIKSRLSTAQSKAQLLGALATEADLLKKQMDAAADVFSSATYTDTRGVDLLSPDAKRSFRILSRVPFSGTYTWPDGTRSPDKPPNRTPGPKALADLAWIKAHPDDLKGVEDRKQKLIEYGLGDLIPDE